MNSLIRIRNREGNTLKIKNFDETISELKAEELKNTHKDGVCDGFERLMLDFRLCEIEENTTITDEYLEEQKEIIKEIQLMRKDLDS